MNRNKALLIDVDNTLVATQHLHDLALHYALTRLNQSNVKLDPALAARPMRVRLLAAGLPPATADTVYAVKKEEYERLVNQHVMPRNGLRSTLKWVASHGVKLVAVSNSNSAMKVLNKARLLDMFERVCLPVHVKQGKPSPDLYLKSMELTKVTPEEVTVFEDADDGIQAATAAGVPWDRIIKTNVDNIERDIRSWW